MAAGALAVRVHVAWWVRPALTVAFLCRAVCPACGDRWIDVIVDHGIKFGVDMKLQQLRTNLPAAASRVNMLPNQRPDTVERKRGSAGVRDRERIRARDCGLCQECQRHGKTTIGAAVDHIKPLWQGGSDDDENKELLCTPCHDAKTAREAAERAQG